MVFSKKKTKNFPFKGEERRCTLKKFIIITLFLLILLYPLTTISATSNTTLNNKDGIEIHYLLGGNSSTKREVIYHNGLKDIEVRYEEVILIVIKIEKGDKKVELIKGGKASWRGSLGKWEFTCSFDNKVFKERGWYWVDKSSLSAFKDKENNDTVPIYLSGCFPDLYSWLAREGPFFKGIYFYELYELEVH